MYLVKKKNLNKDSTISVKIKNEYCATINFCNIYELSILIITDLYELPLKFLVIFVTVVEVSRRFCIINSYNLINFKFENLITF